MTPPLWQRIKDWCADHKATAWWMNLWRQHHQRKLAEQFNKREQD